MKNRSTIKKQCIAAILAAILLVITGVKFFHTCEEGEWIGDTNTEQVSKNTQCEICEFQFTQEADLTIARFSIEPPLFNAAKAFPCTTSQFTSSVGLHFSDRGPPAVA